MIRNRVSSSNIRSIGYCSISQTLEIEFHSGGIYQYHKVPKPVYVSLMEAPSHGSFFAYTIKKIYPFTKIA